MIFRANVIAERLGQHLIADERPVGSPPLIVGDEGLVVLYGDQEGVTVVVAADDEADAERRVMATWSDAFIDELVPVVLSEQEAAVPTVVRAFRRDCVGIENIGHALARCSDRDCEIHHPEVIEDTAAALTAMAWYEAGRREGILGPLGPYAGKGDVCEDCGNELDEDEVRCFGKRFCDSCETQRNFDRAST